MKKHSIKIATGDLEVDKPSGGGKGVNTLYWVDMEIDGTLALHLTRANFKETGQMEAFANTLKELTR